MKDYLIIKVIREAFNDHSLEELGAKRYKSSLMKIKGFAESLGLELAVTVNTSINWICYDSMVDVYCTKELNQENKTFIAEQLKEFMKDRSVWGNRKNKLYQIGFNVFFHKFEPSDVIEVAGDSRED